MNKRDEIIKRIRELRDTNYCKECFYGIESNICDTCTTHEDALDNARQLENELEILDIQEEL